MIRRSEIKAASLTAVTLVALSGLACAPATSSASTCDSFTSYVATTTTPLSFATDVYPILSNTNVSNGCGQNLSCHGIPPSPLDSLTITANTKYLQFLYEPPNIAMAKANLMMASVNAPTMQRVVASNVGASFITYKLAKDRAGLACVNAKCVAGASIGNNMPCGDLMPSLGTIADADRTKILDWIAQGAKD